MAGFGDNPFARVFSPSRQGVLGTIGRFAGFPSDEERMVAKVGGAQQAGLAALQAQIQSGADPKRALMDFIQSDEGMQYFTSGGDLGNLTDFMDTTAPERPELVEGSPGQHFYNRDPVTGKMTFETSTPTTNTQDFTGMADLANLGQDEIEELAAATMKGDITGDMSDKEKGVNRLFQRGLIDENTRDGLLAGVIQTTVDPVTGVTSIVNMATNEMIDPNLSSPRQDVDPALGGVSTDADQALMNEDYEYEEGNIPASIIRGSGATASVLGGVGNFLGEISPSMNPVETNKNRQQIERIRTAFIGLRENTRLAADLKRIDALVASDGDNPVNYGNKLLTAMDFLDEREQQAHLDLANPKATRDQKRDAQTLLSSIDGIRRQMPTREDLIQEIAIAQQESPVGNALAGAGGFVGKAVSSVIDLVRGGERQAEQVMSGPATGAAPSRQALPRPERPVSMTPAQRERQNDGQGPGRGRTAQAPGSRSGGDVRPGARAPRVPGSQVQKPNSGGVPLQTEAPKQQSFKTPDEAIKAIQKGLVNVGDTIILNGVPVVVQQE